MRAEFSGERQRVVAVAFGPSPLAHPECDPGPRHQRLDEIPPLRDADRFVGAPDGRVGIAGRQRDFAGQVDVHLLMCRGTGQLLQGNPARALGRLDVTGGQRPHRAYSRGVPRPQPTEFHGGRHRLVEQGLGRRRVPLPIQRLRLVVLAHHAPDPIRVGPGIRLPEHGNRTREIADDHASPAEKSPTLVRCDAVTDGIGDVAALPHSQYCHRVTRQERQA